jgi:F-type H+-transporting ATPase subunit b
MRTIRTTLALAALSLVPSAARAAEGGAPPLVDLPVVLTQVLGFLLLLWGLRAWAWGPVIRKLEERRARIAGEFAEAERRQKEADALKAKYEQELRGIEAQARQKLLEAVAEGQRVAGEIRADAHAKATAHMARAEEEIRHESDKARELLKDQMAALAVHVAEKILREKLDEKAHRGLVQRFIDEVEPNA